MTEQTRRLFLASGAGLAVGAVAATLAGPNLSNSNTKDALSRSHDFYGVHQNGIDLEAQTFATLLTFNLNAQVTKDDVLRWMTVVTDDAARLTSGRPVLADSQPELAMGPAGLTVTVGFGPGLFSKLNLQDKKPESLQDLPSFSMDRLRPEFTGGDVLIQLAANDPLVISHASRQIQKNAASFATVKWLQHGFTGAKDPNLANPQPRNFMGQIEGTGNPKLGSEDFKKTVWVEQGPSWLAGGTLAVVRRIKMELSTWDQLGRVAKEEVIGRSLGTGAPLGANGSSDQVNLLDSGQDASIPQDAHVRGAVAKEPGERIFRRAFNFETDPDATGFQERGLIWIAYQADIDKQFLPIQRRLERLDALNRWTTPIGSAVFAIPRGALEGEVIGQELFS